MNNSSPASSRCACCGLEIPFNDPRVTDEVADKIKLLIGKGKTITAITELRRLADLDLLDAKYWVDHCGELVGKGLVTGPCPFCGQELRTKDALQCRHCKRDWHDSNNIKTL